MDGATTPNTSTAFSLHSMASATTLVPDQSKVTAENAEKDNEGKEPERYLYYKRIGPPNPDAQPKPKSTLNKLMSKFQSPAVKQANEAREREKLEEERRGVKIYSALGAPAGAWQATSAYMI